MKPIFRILPGVLLVVAVALAYGLSRRRAVPAKPAAAPVERVFSAGEEDRVLDIGTLPGGLSLSMLSELMLRDRILAGQLAAEGWTIREHGFNSGNEMLPYCDGRLDAVFIGNIPGCTAVGLRNFGIFSRYRQGFNTLIASRRITPNELKGLRVGYARKTSTEYTLISALDSVGLTEADIVSVPMEIRPDKMSAALRENKVDAVVAWEPVTTSLLGGPGGASLVYRTDSTSFLAMDLRFAARHPAVQKAFLAALVRATRWAQRDEANRMKILAHFRRRNPGLAAQGIPDFTPKWEEVLLSEGLDSPSFPLVPHDWAEDDGVLHREFRFLKGRGAIPAEVEWSVVRGRIDTALLPEIIKDGKTWRIGEFDYAQEKLHPGDGWSP